MSDLNFRKKVQALNYFARLNGGSLDMLKAMKLIWLSDRLHFREYARTITDDGYYAMQLGPVPSVTYNIAKAKSSEFSVNESRYIGNYLRKSPGYHYKSERETDMDVFSETDIEVMNCIWENFGGLSPTRLSDLSHIFPEWAQYRDFFKRVPTGRKPFSVENFFEPAQDGKGLFESNEGIEIVKEMYHLCS